jgi:hypothetical protein
MTGRDQSCPHPAVSVEAVQQDEDGQLGAVLQPVDPHAHDAWTGFVAEVEIGRCEDCRSVLARTSISPPGRGSRSVTTWVQLA